MINTENLKKINISVQSLIDEGVLNINIGLADSPEPIVIEEVSKHAEERMKERGITKAVAQSYIDYAIVMFHQREGARRMYVAKDGNSIVFVEGRMLISAYSSFDFDIGMKRLISEVEKYGKNTGQTTDF